MSKPQTNTPVDPKQVADKFTSNTCCESIAKFLNSGERVELVPSRDGFKILHIKREEYKERD